MTETPKPTPADMAEDLAAALRAVPPYVGMHDEGCHCVLSAHAPCNCGIDAVRAAFVPAAVRAIAAEARVRELEAENAALRGRLEGGPTP